jgi:CHAD domain-containing protein
MRRVLKKLRLSTEAVRDRDIAVCLLEKLTPSVASPLLQQLRVERSIASKELAVSLRNWKRRSISERWRGALAEAAADPTPIDVTAARVLRKLANKFVDGGDHAVRDKVTAEELHRFRIAAKNLRYTLDLFAPLYGESIDELFQWLKGAQGLLGEINDCATTRRIVSTHAGSAGVLAAIKKRQRKKVEQFRRDWSTGYSDSAMIRRWADGLRHTGAPAIPTRKPVATAPTPSPLRRAARA